MPCTTPKKQLEIGRKIVSYVMDNVGYANAKAFREVFEIIAGCR